ncbi:hypothetical protein AVEN_192251-1, partial [Araneus ventricosus]
MAGRTEEKNVQGLVCIGWRIYVGGLHRSIIGDMSQSRCSC